MSMDIDSKVAELRLTRDRKNQELNDNIKNGKIKIQEYTNKKVKIDGEITKWNNKVKDWENEIKNNNDTFYNELRLHLNLSTDEMEDALINKSKEKEKLNNKQNNNRPIRKHIVKSYVFESKTVENSLFPNRSNEEKIINNESKNIKSEEEKKEELEINDIEDRSKELFG